MIEKVLALVNESQGTNLVLGQCFKLVKGNTIYRFEESGLFYYDIKGIKRHADKTLYSLLLGDCQVAPQRLEPTPQQQLNFLLDYLKYNMGASSSNNIN